MRIAHIHVGDKNNKGDVAIVLAVQELLKDEFRNCRIMDFSVTVLRDGNAQDLKKINTADFVIIGGGGIFYSYFLPYNQEFIKAIKKPLIIFGAGYIREIGARELNSKACESLVALIKAAKLVGVRDNKTKEFLGKKGATVSKIKVIGDPAVLLKEKKLSKFKIEKRKGKIAPVRIGLNLNYSGWLGFGQWREEILGSYRAVAQYFEKEYGGPEKPGVEIYYLKHHPGEDNVYPALNIKNLRVVDLQPGEQKYVYGQLDLVIGMMLHAGVLAFGAGTPEISVAYDLRNYSFAEFIGCPELVVDLDKLQKGILLKRVKEVMAKKENYRKIFARQKEMIKQKQKNFLKNIKKYV